MVNDNQKSNDHPIFNVIKTFTKLQKSTFNVAFLFWCTQGITLIGLSNFDYAVWGL